MTKLWRFTILGTGFAAAIAIGEGGANADSCPAVQKEEQQTEVIGQGGVLSNFVGSRGSLASQIERLLGEGLRRVASGVPQEHVSCPTDCRAGKSPKVALRVVPQSFAAEESRCKTLFTRTSTSPITFEKNFGGDKQLLTWFTDMSLGKNEEGKQLIRDCPLPCSAQYKALVEAHGGQLSVHTEVVCGPPRNRIENAFRVASALVWSCEHA